MDRARYISNVFHGLVRRVTSAQQHQNLKGEGYRADIDGLRAIAVLSVFLYHLDFGLISGGYIGVDIFFVISGFVITSQIFKQHLNNNFSILEFYYRRVKRILPAVYFLLICCSIFAIFTLYPPEYKKFFSQAKQVVLLVPNLYFSRHTDYFEPSHDTSPLLHTWSLGVEEQLYLLFPMLLVWLMRRGINRQFTIKINALLLTSFLLNLYLTRYYPNQAFYMVYARAWEFLIGSIIALGFIPEFRDKFLSKSCAYLGVTLIIYAILTLDKHSIFPGINALYPCLGTGLIIYAGNNQNIISKILSVRFLNFTGQISYSLYLWHWPVIIFYKLLSGYEITIYSAVLIFLATYLLAYLSWRYIEQPFRNYNKISQFNSNLFYKIQNITNLGKIDLKRFNKQAVISYAILFIIILPLGFEILQNNDKAKWRVYQADSGAELNFKPVFISDNEDYQVLLLGDSHAVHYFPAVQKWAESKKMQAKIFSAQACPSVLVDYVTNDRPHIIKACQEHIKLAQKIINSRPEIQYVFLASRQDKYTRNADDLQRFKQALSATVKQLKNQGIQVAILDQVPFFKSPPYYTTLWDKLFDSSRTNSSFANIDYDFINYKLGSSRQVIKDIVNEYHLLYFDPLNYITTSSYQGKAMFSDDNHLNPHGIAYLTQVFDFSV